MSARANGAFLHSAAQMVVATQRYAFSKMIASQYGFVLPLGLNPRAHGFAT
jgi:hypothetical protein